MEIKLKLIWKQSSPFFICSLKS